MGEFRIVKTLIFSKTNKYYYLKATRQMEVQEIRSLLDLYFLHFLKKGGKSIL